MNLGFSLQIYHLALNIKMKLTVLSPMGKMWKCEKCVTSDKKNAKLFKIAVDCDAIPIFTLISILNPKYCNIKIQQCY